MRKSRVVFTSVVAAAAMIVVGGAPANAAVKGGSLNCQSSQHVAAYGKARGTMTLTAGSTTVTFAGSSSVGTGEVFGPESRGAWRVQTSQPLVDAAGWCRTR